MVYLLAVNTQGAGRRVREETRQQTKLNYDAAAFMPQPTVQGTLERCSPFELSHSGLK